MLEHNPVTQVISMIVSDNELLEPYLPVDTAKQTTALREAIHIIEREFSRKINYPLNILDLGCGEGNSIDEFQGQYPNMEWIGIDIEYSQEVKQRSRDDATFITYDGINIPLPDSSQDIVYSHQVFEHVRRPSELLPQVFRILKPDGRFVGSTSHLEPFHSRSYWNFTPYGFASYLTEAGFSNICVRPGIDGLTLIQRRLLSHAKIRLGKWFFEHTSPLNAFLEVVGRAKGYDIKKRAALKLLFCGHFIFSAQKKGGY